MNDHYSGRARRTGLLATAIATTALVATGAHAQDTTAIKPGTVSLGTAPTAIGGAVNIDPTVPPVLDPKRVTDGNKAIEDLSRNGLVLKIPVQLEDAHDITAWKTRWAQEISVNPDSIQLVAGAYCSFNAFIGIDGQVLPAEVESDMVRLSGAATEKFAFTIVLDDELDRVGYKATRMTWSGIASSPDHFIDVDCYVSLNLTNPESGMRDHSFSWQLGERRYGGSGVGAMRFKGRIRNGEWTALWRYWNSENAPGVTYATESTQKNIEELVNKDPHKDLGLVYRQVAGAP